MAGLLLECSAIATSTAWCGICSANRPTRSLAAWAVSGDEDPCWSRDSLPLLGFGCRSLAGPGGLTIAVLPSTSRVGT